MINGKICWNRIIAIIFGLLIIAASALFLAFQTFEIYRINKDLEVQEAFLASAGSIFNNIPDKEELLEIQRELYFIEKIMPLEKNNVEILDYLEMIGAELNVNIISIGFQEDQIKNEYILHPVYVTVQGKYKEIIKYITELRKGTRPFKVSNIKMERQDDNEDILYCELLIYAFYRNPMNMR